ncbi:F-box domain containing protein [Trema orientale]|uniref:F-box domain containing protein n=1 Tax=Trema orientale TaxID=63057 RepID=A0A2P5F357_TREOI|nr:F-box domain containing protein [Trema orientale]
MAANCMTLEGSKNRSEESISDISLDDVSDDILFEILVRLPDCRSVIQKSSVSKRWFSLTFSPEFIRRFTNYHRQSQVAHSDSPPYTLLIQGSTTHSPFYQVFSEKSEILHRRLPSSDDSITVDHNYLNFFSEPMVVHASFEDLLLVSPPISLPLRDLNYYVCNPLTRQWLELPAAPPRGWNFPCGYGLVCDRAQHTVMTRFRVVLLYSLLFPPDCSDQLLASIFRSETGNWIESLVRAPSQFAYDQEFSPLCQMSYVESKVGLARNGSLHWLFYNSTSPTACVVVAFNPFDETKQWRFIPPPADLYNPRFNIPYHSHTLVRILRLGVCRDRLRAYLVPNRGGLMIWELIHNHDVTAVSWSLVYDAGCCAGREVRYYGLSLHPSRDSVVFFSRGNRVFQSNVSKGVLEKVHKFEGKIGLGLCAFLLVHPPWPTPIPSI